MFNTKYLELYINQNKDVSNLSLWLEKNKKHWEKVDELEHICDYFMSVDNPNYGLSFTNANAKAKGWIKSMKKDTTNEIEGEDYEVVYKTKDGKMKFVKLLTKQAYENESANMRHCIKTYWGNDREVFSLRDDKNLPHATMDIVRGGDKIMQIQGKGDNTVDGKYQEYNIEFFESMGFNIDPRFMEKIGYCDVEQYKKYLVEGIKLLRGKYYKGSIDQSIFRVKICNGLSDMTEDTVLCGGDLHLEGYSHPLPSGFTHCGGSLYLRGYSHPLPSGFTHCGGSLYLRGYSHPLPSGFTHCGGYLHLEGYNHPLPSGFTHCGGYLDLRGYSHPLPSGFTHCGGYLYLEGYNHPLPSGFTHCGGYLHLEGYNHPLPSGFTHCGGYLDLRGYPYPLPSGFKK